MNISIILSAGEGTRMKSKHPKILHKVCGLPLAEHVLRAVISAGIEKNVMVVGNSKEAVINQFKERVYFREQKIGEGLPYGTGYAVMQAIDIIEDGDNVIVLSADTPLIKGETLKNLISFHEDQDADVSVLSCEFENPFNYGRIIRKNGGDLEKIVEEKDATAEEKEIKEINSGIYIFKAKALKSALGKLSTNNAQGEYYLTDTVEIIIGEKGRARAYKIDNYTEILGVNSRSQLSDVERIMQREINSSHMNNGVSLINPENIFIDRDVEIGRDTIIHSGAVIQGKTIIGEDVEILGNTRIADTEIGDSCYIENSVLEDCKIRNKVHLGPYTHIRPKSEICDGAKLGNFVEVKNSIIGKGTKAAHLSYIGDADVGEYVNFGCSSVLVNYDGANKHRSTIGDHVFIGCDTKLISPVEIEDWAYTAAGSTIYKDVKENQLAIERTEQVNIDNWVMRRGLRNNKK